MNLEKATVVKITADIKKYDLKTIPNSTSILQSEQLYIQISNPFYQFIYELIDKNRNYSIQEGGERFNG